MGGGGGSDGLAAVGVGGDGDGGGELAAKLDAGWGEIDEEDIAAREGDAGAARGRAVGGGEGSDGEHRTVSVGGGEGDIGVSAIANQDIDGTRSVGGSGDDDLGAGVAGDGGFLAVKLDRRGGGVGRDDVGAHKGDAGATVGGTEVGAEGGDGHRGAVSVGGGEGEGEINAITNHHINDPSSKARRHCYHNLRVTAANDVGRLPAKGNGGGGGGVSATGDEAAD